MNKFTHILSVLVFFVVMILSISANANDGLLDIKVVESESGVQAWLVEDHSVPVISLQFSFKDAGAKNDPEGKDGLARLASNTMDEGAGDLDATAFQKRLQDLAIDLRFTSGRDRFGGYVKTVTQNKDEAFRLLKLALHKPRFDEEPVERMRKANQSRIRDSQSDPDWLSMRIMNDKAFAGHSYARNSGGTLSSLEKITPDDLRGFHKTLTRDKVQVAAAGDITEQELKTLLDDIFGTLPKATETALQPYTFALKNTGKTFVYQKDIPQTIILMQQEGVDRGAPNYHAAKVMNYILGAGGFGSRLMEEVREKRGLTYGIYSYFSDMVHIDTMLVQTSTKNESVDEAIKLIKAEWERMKTQPVSTQELDDAKAYLIGSLPLSLTSTDKISGLLLGLQMDNLPVDYLDQRKTAIENLTPEDIQNVAADLLTPDKFVSVLVGNPTTLSMETVEIKEVNGVE